MIDIENKIFNTIANSLRALFPEIFITGEKVAAPKSYPCVSIEEADNYAYIRSQDSVHNENHIVAMYEVQIFSNKTSGKKSECKKIFAAVDEEFNKIGFVRKTKQPIPMDDAKSYQYFGRYEAIVSKEHIIFRR